MRYAEAVKQLELTRRICDPLRYVFLDEADTALEDEGDDDVSEQILGAMDVRLLPIVTLGQSRTDLSHKLSCLTHAIDLETGCGDVRNKYLDAVVGCCSDQGRFTCQARTTGALAASL